ncbi:hypothetical protein WOLCODRAFT_167493 [Wolfiporia cocos MD-104 SS10]|uniref:Uncharacterized protein n=1 Tax=Wolfiporia cocos (strain MD-104) TaxID=742152 RepID=A0A2H3JFD0_WOLCO|nr:hypothetical protein WOLCODRAFT_167493 [Wolfiporia cocos MD-104 SS10]
MLPFPRPQNISNFEVERMPGNLQASQTPPQLYMEMSPTDVDSESAFRASIAALISAKARPFAVSGRIPIDPAALTLFFRSKSRITHSIDFPIDIDHDLPPSMEVLIEACQPRALPYNDPKSAENPSLFYPQDLPLTTSLELANHPILDAVRNTLFPSLPMGHYLTAIRDKLELVLNGGSTAMHRRPTDKRVATVIVTLPVRFRGGALVVRCADGREERFTGRGGKGGDLEWVAFTGDCDYAVDAVQKGCKATISYGVQLRSFGPAAIQPDPLIAPSDQFLDMLSPILNASRGRRIALYLTGDYGVDPGEVLAETLVANLKGGDSVLYHAIKLYKLAPELRWTAGGYIWPVDQTVQIGSDSSDSPNSVNAHIPTSFVDGGRSPPMRGLFSAAGPGSSDLGDEDGLRRRIKKSGATAIADTDIIILSNVGLKGTISKERVPFVHSGELERLVVNVLLVVFVP